MDRLKRFIAQRYALTPGICLVIGIWLHVKGYKLDGAQQDWVQQQVAAIFDVLALIAGQSSARFAISQKKSRQIETAVDINSAVANPIKDTGDQLPVTVDEVCRAEEAKK